MYTLKNVKIAGEGLTMVTEEQLVEALQAVVKRYVDLVDCGDCGDWNPHEDEPIMKAELLLKQIEQERQDRE